MRSAIVPLALFAVSFGAVWIFAIRNPLLGTLASREATRRRGQTALVVGGLMVGTATITAALVAADSVGDSTVDAFAYRNWGHVDITVTAGGNDFFAPAVAAAVAADPQVAARTDGVMGAVEIVGSASNLTRKQGTSRVVLLGFDPAAQRPFGAYELAGGRRTFGEDLGPRELIVSRTLADQIDARAGDLLRVSAALPVPSSAGSQRPASAEPLRVAGVARAEGPGAYTLGAVVFAPLATLQDALGVERINMVRVSAPGGIRGSLDAAQRALPAVEAAVRAATSQPLVVRNAKKREADLTQEATGFIRAMLVGMSAIVVAAGAALVVNITGMLAEERRARLGILRALGLRRRRVVGLSVIEGAMYAVAAGVAGTFVGIAAGRLVAARFGRAFAEFAGEDLDFEFFFALKPATVLTGFAIGSVLTLLVIFVASRRTARMTITAAIRNLPEPAAPRPARAWPRRVRLAAGAAFGGAGVATGSPIPQLAGGVALVLVAAALARPRLSPRVHATVTGLLLAVLAFVMIAPESPEQDPGEFFGLFVIALLTSVYGLTILAMANLHVIDTLAGAGSARIRAMLRPPLAYLSRRPVRTGLTTAVFALVIAMLTLFAVFLVVFKPSYQTYSSGYDVRVLSTGSANVALPSDIPGGAARTLTLPTRGYVGPFHAEGGFTNAERIFIPIFEIPADAARRPPIALEQRDDRFASDAAVWRAVLADPKLVVTNFGAPGQTITMRAADGSDAEFVVAGLQSFGLLDGVFVAPAAVGTFAGAPLGATLLVDVRDDARATAAARAIERSLFEQGVDADPIRELYESAARANRAMFSTIGILMRMGLVVGILSLGIVALRVVTERRQTIGVLRAIGYRRRAVMAGLLTEAAATATIGVVVGATVGTIMGWIFWRQQENAPPFGIDWANFAGVLAIVYVATLAVTLAPAWRASRLPPAEAVRYSE